MSKISVIIPSRNEKYLCKTVDGVFAKAKGEVEVIAVIDGPSDYAIPEERPNLVLLRKEKAEGLKKANMDASNIATGKYLMKIDAHILLSEGFDEQLKKDIQDDWVMSSRYKVLDEKTWTPIPNTDKDYFYLACPWTNPRKFAFMNVPWKSRDIARKDIMLDETMTLSGCFWFVNKDYFHNKLEGFDIAQWGTWPAEQEELSLKAWLGGGKVMINKNIWHAHYQRPMEERRVQNPDFSRTRESITRYNLTRHYVTNQWKGQVHDFGWLVDRFWPLPLENNRTREEKYYWPENWRQLYEKYLHG
jgi:glycosyltransferase involved in cell wall biosynthesis